MPPRFSRASFVLATLVGSVVVHFALTACSGGNLHSPFVDGSAPAQADSPAATCSQWEAQGFIPPSFTFVTVTQTKADGTTGSGSFPVFSAFPLPAGWEPISGSEFGSITARHCIAP